MKKVFLMLVIAVPIWAQQFVEAPRYMVKDTLNVTTRCVRDFYFNSANSAMSYSASAGSIDLDIYADVINQSAATDTMTVEIYGLKRKMVDASAIYPTVMVGDSMNVGTIALSSTATFESYAIDVLYTSFEMFDGLRVVYKKGGSDDDSLVVYSNVRCYWLGK
jgi:hypothetical protein